MDACTRIGVGSAKSALLVVAPVRLRCEARTAFASKLSPDKFIRVHRSVIVNVDRIQRIEPRGHGDYLITLRDGTRVASSQAYNERLREMLR